MSQELPSTFKLLTIWLLILTAVFLAVLAWQHQRERPRFTLNERELRLQRGPDGHFHWPGRLAGRDTVFLVDTGASAVALTPDDAKRLGFEPSKLNYAYKVMTANGEAHAAAVKLASVSVAGTKVTDVDALVLDKGLDASLLGMTYLGRLSRFEATRSSLILRP